MVGLMDIAPSTRTVRVGGDLGDDVPVYGVSAKGIAALLTQFPELKNMMQGKNPAITVESVIKVAPDAIAAIIAAGTGSPGDMAAIQRAELIPAGTQAEFLDAILELTMPDGLGPFVEALSAIMQRLDFDGLGKDPVTKSQ